jgi:hypothetical protein
MGEASERLVSSGGGELVQVPRWLWDAFVDFVDSAEGSAQVVAPAVIAGHLVDMFGTVDGYGVDGDGNVTVMFSAGDSFGPVEVPAGLVSDWVWH